MADQIRATPQNATLGAIANLLKQTYAPQRTQQMQGMMEFLGLPALARTVERVSYGEPVTNINKANVPLLPADTAEAAMLAGPPLASLAKRVGTNLVQTAPFVARDMAQSMSSPLRSYVVKPKGGNWLAGSVERAIKPMKTDEDLVRIARENGVPLNEERLTETDAINRWLDTKLGKYIRNEMATPEDPLRLQADAFPAIKAEQLAVKDAQLAKARADMEAARQARGFTPEMMTSSQARIRDLERERDFIDAQMGIHAEVQPTGYNVTRARREAGFPEEGMGVSDLAKKWEDRADTFVNELEAFDLTSAYPEVLKDNPWLLKVPPETRVYDMLRGADEDLGFAHLTDELRNALNPESGLPRELLLKYSDLDKMSVPQVAKRVDEINAWRSVQKAEADMARAGNAATQVVKEYPEQGIKWVELRAPEVDVKALGYTTEKVGDLYHAVDPQGNVVLNTRSSSAEEALKRAKPAPKELEDALKYEGETMGHCVGGYCPDVVEGRSRIYSLRDKKGQPHVTIEVQPVPGSDPVADIFRQLPREEQMRIREAALGKENAKMDQFVIGREADENRAKVRAYMLNERPDLADLKPAEDIVQIKGKGNKAPKEDYLPAVQDFVRSGNFGKVGDLQNTGMVKFGNEYRLPSDFLYRSDEGEWVNLQDAAKQYFPDSPTKQNNFITGAMGEPQSIKLISKEEGFAGGGAIQGYAAGGLVAGANFPTGDFDPARIDAMVSDLYAMNTV
jgi:hypothetical protein